MTVRAPTFTGRQPNYGFASDAGFPLEAGHGDPYAMVFLTGTSPLQQRHQTKVYVQSEEDGAFSHVKGKHASWFNNSYELVGNLQGIAGVLDEKRHAPRDVLIRGGVLNAAPKRHRRTSNAAERTVVDVARRWVMVDVDAAVAGESVPEDWMRDPEAAVRPIVKNHLPEAFHDAGVVAHFSSGMSRHGGTPKVHLYFMLSRPLYSIEVKQWLAREIHEKKIDGALFQPVQQHFTADPQYMLHDGTQRPDALGATRVTLVDGPDVVVPDTYPRFVPPQHATSGHDSGDRDRPYYNLPWRDAVDMTGEGGKGYHDWIRDTVIPNYWRQEDIPRKAELQAALQEVPHTDDDRHYDRTGPDFDRLWDSFRQFIELNPTPIPPEDIASVQAERAARPVMTPELWAQKQAAAHAHIHDLITGKLSAAAKK